MSGIENMIRPDPSQEEIFNTLKNKYGLKIKSCKPLVGYDDKNYRIQVYDEFENNFIKELHPDGYVLKIINSLDSQNTVRIEGQNEMMFHLDKNGFNVPTPVKNVHGEYHFFEFFGDTTTKHIVRLLKYQVGEQLDKVKPNHTLYFNLGVFTAQVDNCLLTFDHPGCETDIIWTLKNAPKIMAFIDVIIDPKRKKIVEKTIEDFKNIVLPQISKFDKGVIHGDINEHNVLVDGDKIKALLDFGDVAYSVFLFEAATAICYILAHSGEIFYGKSFLDGYKTIRTMKNEEIQLLNICVSARLCQSLVLGVQSAKKDPTNEYVLSTQQKGWAVLEQLSSMSNEKLLSVWNP